MWYRTSATRVDPTGQINIDYPNIKPYFDIDPVYISIQNQMMLK